MLSEFKREATDCGIEADWIAEESLQDTDKLAGSVTDAITGKLSEWLAVGGPGGGEQWNSCLREVLACL
jgi:hypothetical protein